MNGKHTEPVTDSLNMITPDAQKWVDFVWPDWVPVKVRIAIEGFWSDKYGRGPQAWMENSRSNHAPAFGSVVTLPDGWDNHAPLATGRFVFAWNNIARLIRDDGSFAYVTVCRKFDPEKYLQEETASLRHEKGDLSKRMAALDELEERLRASWPNGGRQNG